jgi:hypothetical protein
MARACVDSGGKTEAIGRRPNGPEDLSLGVRCITFGLQRLGAGYNSYYQILQTPKAISIQTEMIHDARIVPLDRSPDLPSNVKLWLGDPRGHWGRRHARHY